MRNSNRLNGFYDQFCALHREYFPDWRFGQLCSNFFVWLYQNKKVDLFFPEEDQMLDYFREYCEQNSMWSKK